MSEDTFRIEQPQPDTLAVSGALNFRTAAQVLDQAAPMLERGVVHVLDLSGVRNADSAGLACVVSMIARARQHGSPLRIRDLPESMQRLAAVSDAESLLA